MKLLLLMSILLSALPLRLEADTATESYTAGLAAEKSAGDLASAVAHYREVLQQYRAGQADPSLAFRARQRLSFLGEESALESPAPPRLPFQTLSDRLGVTTGERLTPSDTSTGSVAIVGFPLSPRYAARWEAGQHPSISQDQDRILEVISRQIRVIRYAVGISGLLEYVEEMVANSQRPRRPSPNEFYQAGLIAERQKGDLEEAISFYNQALVSQAIDSSLHHQIDRRLTRCQERLAHRVSPAPERSTQ